MAVVPVAGRPVTKGQVPGWLGLLAIGSASALLLYWLLVGTVLEAAVGGVLLGALSSSWSSLWVRNLRRFVWVPTGLLLVLFLPVSYIEGTSACRECGSMMRSSSLGWGVRGAWIRFEVWDRITPSHALRDFFPPDTGTRGTRRGG
jgi:hypothetical protein